MAHQAEPFNPFSFIRPVARAVQDVRDAPKSVPDPSGGLVTSAPAPIAVPDMPGVTYTIELLPAGRPFVPVEYQARLNPRRVAEMVAGWVEAGIGTWEVSRRPDGGEALMDGQHRQASLIRLGRPNEPVPARVFSGLNLEQEIAIYRALANRKQKTRANLIHAAARGGEAVAVATEDVAAEFGLRLPVDGAFRYEPGVVSAPAELLKLVAERGVEHTRAVLGVISAAWGGDPHAYKEDVIKGVSQFLRCYPEVPQDAVAAALRGSAKAPKTPNDLIDFAKRNRLGGGSTTERAGAAGRAVLHFFNYKRTSRSLPDRFVECVRSDRRAKRDGAA